MHAARPKRARRYQIACSERQPIKAFRARKIQKGLALIALTLLIHFFIIESGDIYHDRRRIRELLLSKRLR